MLVLGAVTISCKDDVEEEFLSEQTQKGNGYDIVFCTDDTDNENSLRSSFLADNVGGWNTKKGTYFKNIYATVTSFQPTLATSVVNGVTLCPTGLDMNEGAGGDYVYLWIEYTNDENEGIRDLGSTCSRGSYFDAYNYHPSGLPDGQHNSADYALDLLTGNRANLNSKSESAYTTHLMYYKSVNFGDPIKGLLEISSYQNQSVPDSISYAGYTYYRTTNDLNYSDPRNKWGKQRTGKKIYLYWRK
ncbi:MAG: hypothetical protein J6Y37_07945 [Paludibacteraceae bacterium]|nr:hypothetical protein [Paludibacteraceae bacterium]